MDIQLRHCVFFSNCTEYPLEQSCLCIQFICVYCYYWLIWFFAAQLKVFKKWKTRLLKSLRALLCRQHILQQPDENAVWSTYGPSVTWLSSQSCVSSWSWEHSWIKISTTHDLDHFRTPVQANPFFHFLSPSTLLTGHITTETLCYIRANLFSLE